MGDATGGVTGSADHHLVNLIGMANRYGRRVNPRNGERLRVFAPPAVRFAAAPLVGLRKTAWKTALREMEWFLSGSNRIGDAHPAVRKWWQPWADPAGRVWFNYSEQLRRQTFVERTGEPLTPTHEDGFDQVAAFLDGIRTKPHSARHVITTWYSPEMYSPACPITNCHGTVIQASVNDGTLDLFMYQRSADLICGVPHNWIQYWAFLLWVCHRTGHRPGEFVWQGGDVHVYAAHLRMADKMLRKRDVMTELGGDLPAVPNLEYTPTGDAFTADDFSLDGPYRPVICEPVEMVV